MHLYGHEVLLQGLHNFWAIIDTAFCRLKSIVKVDLMSTTQQDLMRVSNRLLDIFGKRFEGLIIGEVAVVNAALGIAGEYFAIGGFDVYDAETQ